MRMNIIYISKLEFLYTFKKAFFALITKISFRGGLPELALYRTT